MAIDGGSKWSKPASSGTVLPNPLPMKKNTYAIIPAAGKPTNKILTHTNLPDTMLPINGKPVIGYILEDIKERGIEQVVIVLNEADDHTEKYVMQKFGTKLKLTVVRNTAYHRGVGYSILQAAKYVTKADGVLVYLGDTIYKGPLSLDSDFLVTTSAYEASDKWCFVETSDHGLTFINKPKAYTGDGHVLAGLYYFSDAVDFHQALTGAEQTEDRLEIFHLLDRYQKPFTLVPAELCYDCGNIENYYKAKIDFLRTRSFNTVHYNDLYGSITKSGDNAKKLQDEIAWYENIPEPLKIFSPRLIASSDDDKKTEYTLEYYGYQSLADYFAFNHFDDRLWQLIIDRLFDILGEFKKFQTSLPFTHYDEMYRKKTINRIEALTKDETWANLFTAETITINGIVYAGWPTFEKQLKAITADLYDQSPMTFLHGDLCLSNILFDPHSRIFKFIDPRGNFGTPSVYGDHHYDIAKLRHSFASRYDFIVSDLFIAENTSEGFIFETFHEAAHERISAYFDTALVAHGYNLQTIRTIEALLFISMLPLHSDSPSRQRAMFLTGIKLLNTLDL